MNIVLLTTTTLRSQIVYHYLNDRYTIAGVVLDNSWNVSTIRRKRYKRRISKLGLPKVLLQTLFTTLVLPLLQRTSKKRIAFLIRDIPRTNPENHASLLEVNSINDSSVPEFIEENQADLVIVHGTSILSKGTLTAISVPVINFHIGITPNYRGLFGGYWALYNKDVANFGSTIHYVNEGIDTGEILVQKRLVPDKSDNYFTYPIFQTVACLECFDEAIGLVERGTRPPIEKQPEQVSRYYSLPTLTQYVYGMVFKAVK